MSLNKIAETKNYFPYEIKPSDPEILIKDSKGERPGYVQVEPKKWFLPVEYIEGAEYFYNFEFRKDDVVIITFPRSGTTWTQEMIWLLCNDLNYEKASEQSLVERFSFLEYNILFPEDTQDLPIANMINPDENQALVEPDWKLLPTFRGKRFIKTHLPFDLLPPNLTKVGCKIIYVARNPKDVAVSFYHLQYDGALKHEGFTGNFQQYWEYFERNLRSWTPYWEHVKEGWSKRNEENVLFTFYEDMIKDLRSSIQKVATFLGKSCIAEDLDKLENHLTFENFKTNKSVNLEILAVKEKHTFPFIRTGKIGGWKNYFDEELEKRADEWIERNLKNTDLKFPI